MLNKKFLIRLLSLVICFCLPAIWWCIAAAQENKKEETFKTYHQVSIFLSHAQVFEGRDDEGKRKTLSLPAWSIDYTYCFHPKWALGLHTDIVIEKYKVEKSEDNEIIERSFPVGPALMGIYKPTEHWSFLLGMGAEFAKEENFILTRAGVEYGTELPKEWEVSGSFSYDFKWNAYDTWTIGIGITKKFGFHK